MSVEPIYGCSGCAGAGRSGCWIHGSQASVMQMMANLYHVHEWRLAGQLADGQALLVCPHHEPPETRLVKP